MIVVEGLDASGKSTLCEALGRHFQLPVHASEGPPKFPNEINERVLRYNAYTQAVFDRHPCVSQPIYAQLRTSAPNDLNPHLIQQFYALEPIFIYCHPIAIHRHTYKYHDSAEHLAAVDKHRKLLLDSYQMWAFKHAHIIYRIGDDVDRIIDLLSSYFDDVSAFHRKFHLTYTSAPRELPIDLSYLRSGHLLEELKEYYFARTLEQKFDALIDIVYVALGTAYLHGFNFNEGWRRVHAANMRKVRASSPAQSSRNSAYDVIKPQGWQPSSLADLVQAIASSPAVPDRPEREGPNLQTESSSRAVS